MATRVMKAAVLHGPEDVRLEDIPVPEIGPGEVLVRIRAALTCGTDAKVYRRGGHPTMIRPPAPFGHEFAGDVAAVGSAVRGFTGGDRVVAANSAPCNLCRYCRMGRPSLCTDILYINGAYAEYIAIPERIVRQNLLHISPSLSYSHAALVEPLACVLHGVEESHVHIGDVVVVNGAGPIGLLFVKLAKLAGASVIAVDKVAGRLEFARQLGADHVVDASRTSEVVAAVRQLTPGGEGADVAVDATGSEQVWEAAVRMVRRGGLVNLFGGCKPGTSFSVETSLLHYSEITIKGVYHHTPHHVRRALDLLATRQVPAELFISRELPLADLPLALNAIMCGDDIKIAVIP